MCWPLSIGLSDQGWAVTECTPASSVCTKHFDRERRGAVERVCYKSIKGKVRGAGSGPLSWTISPPAVDTPNTSGHPRACYAESSECRDHPAMGERGRHSWRPRCVRPGGPLPQATTTHVPSGIAATSPSELGGAGGGETSRGEPR